MAAVAAKRLFSSKVIPKGPGGRSSVSGVVATVFGATGFLGRYVVNRLGRVGSQLVIPYRGNDHDYRHLKPMSDLGQMWFFPYALFDYEAVKKLVRHSNVVINLVGQDHNSRHFTLDDVNVSGARIIARAAKEEGVGRLIHVSALNANENAPSNFYRTKALGEKAVLEEFPNATILRPSVIFGAEDRSLTRIADYKALISQRLPLPDGGKATKKPIYVGDVAEAIVQSVSQPFGVYELTGPTSYTIRQIATYVSQLLRMPDHVIPVPSQLLLLVGRLLELSPLDPLATREEFYRYITSDKLTGLPGLEQLGIAPTHMEKVALSYLRRYRRHAVHDEILQE